MTETQQEVLEKKDPRDNLRPQPRPPFRSGAEAQEMGRRGGSAKTPSKSLAARLRELKKKGLKKETLKILYDMMSDKEINELEMLTFIRQIRAEAVNTQEKLMVTKLWMDWHKIRHGTKEKSDININLQENTLTKVTFLLPEEFKKLKVQEQGG